MPHRLSLRPNGKHRKQRATDYSVTINGLMTRRSLLLSEKPDTLTDDLAAIDYVLKLCGFNDDPQAYMPARRKKGIFKKGEKIRLIRQILQDADRPLTGREICLAALSGKDFDMSDKKRLNQTTVGIYIALCAQHKHGRIDRIDAHPAKWAMPSASSL